jgi:autotransporter-associated beta strand protein
LVLNPTSASASIGSLTLTGTGNRITVALTLNGTSTGNKVTGPVSLPAGRPVTKTGTGTWILSGANTYTGATTVSAGTLLLDGGGSLASASVSVNAGTFGGNGTVSGTVSVGGIAILEAGASLSDTATLTLANNLTLSPGSIIAIGLGSTPTTHDILSRTGGTWSFQSNQAFTFLDQGVVGGVTYTGIITGLAADPGVGSWTATNPGWTGTFTYNNDGSIDLLYPVPEPGTWILVGIGLTFTLYRKRDRRFDDRD